jgi:hypothetical protein
MARGSVTGRYFSVPVLSRADYHGADTLQRAEEADGVGHTTELNGSHLLSEANNHLSSLPTEPSTPPVNPVPLDQRGSIQSIERLALPQDPAKEPPPSVCLPKVPLPL